MLKKIAKLLPIVFFIMTLGLTIYLSNSNISRLIVPKVKAGNECKAEFIHWYQGDKSGTYNGKSINVTGFCLRVEAENCKGYPVSITKYWCSPHPSDGNCLDHGQTWSATIDSDNYTSPNICEDFNRIGNDCPMGQLDGAVGNPNVSNGWSIWSIDESYCTSPSPTPTLTPTPTSTPDESTASGRVYCQDLPYPTDISQQDTWRRLSSGFGTYPWTDGGPTAGYEDPGAGTGGRVAIFNGKWVWFWDIASSDWANTSPTDISSSPTWQELQPGSDGTYPWTDGGPTAGWHGPKNKRVQICNRNWCWSWDYENQTWASTSPVDISSSGNWANLTSPDGTKPWTNGGPTAGWTNTQMGLTAVCNGKWCWNWDIESESWANETATDISQHSAWKSQVNPAPDGTYPWSNGGPTAGWLNSGMNLSAVLNQKWVWNYHIINGEWHNDNTVYPLPNLQMTIVRNSLGNTTVPTNNEGYFQVDLTGETGLFAIRIPDPLPSGTLSNGWPYENMLGPNKNEKKQCDTGYESCDPYHEQYTDNSGFDFRFTNCAPPPPYPQCNYLKMEGPEVIQPGDGATFECNGTLNNDQEPYYQFRIFKNEALDELSSVGESNYWDYIFSDYGDYTAQCRICTSTDVNSCQEWEELTAIDEKDWYLNISTECPDGSPLGKETEAFFAQWPPSPLEWSYQTISANGGTVSLDYAGEGSVYLGLTYNDIALETDPNNCPHNEMTCGSQYFNPYTPMFKWTGDLPHGPYTLNFLATQDMCQ